MKKIFLFFFLSASLTSNFCFGQTDEISSNQLGKTTISKTDFYSGVLAKSGDNYIVIKNAVSIDIDHLTSVPTLQLIDEKGVVIKSNELKTEIDGKNFVCRKPINFGGKTYMVGTVSTLKDEPKGIYLYEIELSTLDFKGNPLKICSYESGYTYYAPIGGSLSNLKRESLEFHEMGFALSPDNKFIGFVTKGKFVDGAKQKHHIALYSDELNLVYEKDVFLNHNDEDFYAQKVYVDSYGTISICGEKLVNDDPSKTEFHIVSFTEKGAKMNDLKVQNAGTFHAETMTKENKILVFSIKFNSANKQEGIFTQSIDPVSNQVETTNYKAFDQELIKFYFGKDFKVGSMLQGFALEEIVPRENGGFYLLGESSGSSSIVNYSSGAMGGTYTSLSYGPILICSISSTMEVEWFKEVKRSMTISASFYATGSFSNLVMNDNLVLLYNDDPRNVNDFNANYGFTPSGGCVTKTIINKEGEIKKSMLFDKDQDVFIRFSGVEAVGDNKIFLTLKNGGGELFGVVPIKL